MEILKTRRDITPQERPAQTIAIFQSGYDFQLTLRTCSIDVSRVRAFRRVDSQAAAGTITISDPLVSQEPIVCGQPDASGVISWYSAADRIFLNADASDMFAYFSNCELIDLSGVSSASTWNLGNMFSHCESLELLDLTAFSTANVRESQYMFDGCEALRTIYMRHSFIAPIVTSGMFRNCTSLVGGAGTAYSSSHTDGTYARIDNPPDFPGYFTRG